MKEEGKKGAASVAYRIEEGGARVATTTRQREERKNGGSKGFYIV